MGSFLLEDMNSGVDINCEGITGEGTVGTETGNVGARFALVTRVTFSLPKCKSNVGELLEMTIIHLPWLIALVLNGTSFLGPILGTGAGAPGYKIVLDVLGVTETDECTSETGTTEVTNDESATLAKFLESTTEAESATCSLSKKSTGLVVGELLIFSTTSGLAIAVSET
jgi:hypothetical protein